MTFAKNNYMWIHHALCIFRSSSCISFSTNACSSCEPDASMVPHLDCWQFLFQLLIHWTQEQNGRHFADIFKCIFEWK